MKETLRTRLDRLEAKRGGAGAGPSVIFLYDAITGEPGAALLMGGGGLLRETGEAADAFTARALIQVGCGQIPPSFAKIRGYPRRAGGRIGGSDL